MAVLTMMFCGAVAAVAVGKAGQALHTGVMVSVIGYPANAAVLDEMRRRGDLPAQRRHIWDVIAYLTHPVAVEGRQDPLFQTWHGEADLFASASLRRAKTGLFGFSPHADPVTGTDAQADVPVISYTLYNDPAYDHITSNRLNERKELDRLLTVGAPDRIVAHDQMVSPFPARSIVLKTVWWPVAQNRVTALPVWDPQDNHPDPHGNPYINWKRVVGVTPFKARGATASLDFAGRSFQQPATVPLDDFYHITLDASLADRMMHDPETRKTVWIVLGRPLKGGDHLILVSANLMTREVEDWIWATFWWHDHPGQGAFADGRPRSLPSPWCNYLMQAAFDMQTPAAPDNGPHVAFNPWLEGRFPDGGQGDGMASNCMTCHQRASYPQINFLPVTRGAPDFHNDKAFAPGRLRTSFLWSLAMHARP